MEAFFNYSDTKIEFRIKNNKNSSILACPSLKKPEGFIALVTSSEYSDRINYSVEYSTIIQEGLNFITIEERRNHFKENKAYYKQIAKDFGIEDIHFDFHSELQFGRDISILNDNPLFKGNSLLEKFVNFDRNRD